MRARHRVEWWLLHAFVFLTAGLWPPLRPFLARVLALLAYDLVGVRRRVVEENLARAFGDLPPSSRRRIGRRAYENLAMGALEMAALSRLSPEALSRLCRIEGRSHLEEALALGRGAILVTAHLGNWEYLGACLGASGVGLLAVGAPMRNRAVDRWLRALRARFGLVQIPLGRNAGRLSLKALREGRPLLLLIDQDARSRGVWVDFFGVPASTHPGAAVLSLHTGSPIVPCRIARMRSGHVIRFFPPRHVASAGSRQEAIRATMQTLTRMVEGWIREDPSAWFWPHRRFKTKPHGARGNEKKGGA